MSVIPVTSIETWCLETIRQQLETMARQDVFREVGNDEIASIIPAAVISRINRRPSKDGSTRGGERLNNLPGFICTYLGHKRPINAGENCVDDGVITVIVQLVDDGDDSDARNLSSYLQWMNDARKRLLKKPGSHLSPLEDCPSRFGQVYMVHVDDSNPPDETDWGFHEKMRMSLSVKCLTRTPR